MSPDDQEPTSETIPAAALHPIVLLGTFAVLVGMVGAMVGVSVVGSELGLETRWILYVSLLIPAHTGLFVAAVFMRLAFDQRRKLMIFVGAGALTTALVALTFVDVSGYQEMVEQKALDDKEAAGLLVLTDPTQVQAKPPLGDRIQPLVDDVPRTSPTSRDILEDRYVKPRLE